ncbi:reverse transcriptase domain-containing protein [Tanacetum coccineum]
MDRARHDKRKEVQTILDFGESPKKIQRERENSLNLRAGDSPIRFHHERSRTRGRERHDNINVFNRLSHRKKSVHERLSDTYSPSITKSGPSMASSRDPSHNRGRSLKSTTSDRGHWKSKAKRRKPADEEDLAVERWAMPTWCHMFNSTLIGAARVWFDKLPPESIDGYKGLKAVFLAYFMQQNKYVKDLVEIHNIKQRDGETIEEFMELNNPELTKRLNEHVPKTVEEMMTATTTFIRGETAVASKKKVQTTTAHGNLEEKEAAKKFARFHNDNGHNMMNVAVRKQIKELVLERSSSSISLKEIREDEINKRLEKGIQQRQSPWPFYMIQAVADKQKSDATEVDYRAFARVKRDYVAHHDRIRPGKREIQAVPSTAHRMLKFPVNGGIVTIRSTILMPTECATIAATPKDTAKKAEARHENFKGNLDIFAWKPSDMTGVPRSISKHRLDIREGYPPVRQKKEGRPQSAPKAIQSMRAAEGMFLGYMISPKGIKPYPDKTEAENRRGTATPSAKKSLPLFKTLKKCIKKSDFHWTPDAEQAFKQLKQHLSELPLLVAPKPKKERIVYLSASHIAISAVLMTERGTVQTPVYFRFFQAHLIAVITDQPIKQIISRPDVAGRLQKMERHAGRTQYHVPAKDICKRTDPSGFPYGSCAGLILTSPEGMEFTYALRFQCTASKNKAEYEALIAGLRIAAQMGVRNVHMSVDSKLVANHVLRTYVPKEENMVKYLEKAKNLIIDFANFSISQVPRSLGQSTQRKFVQEEEVVTVVKEEGPTWMTSIIEYLKDETLPDDRKEASKLRIKARQYELLEWVLYRRSFLKPWLGCVGPLQVNHGPGKVKFLIVAMDYFMKWIEAKAVATITDNQSNGLVERANRSLGEGIKARLGEGNKNWIEELPHVLWAHRTMIKSSHVDTIHNGEELRLNLDLLEERRERAAIREAKAKLKMTKYYNARVRGVTFRPEDFVYRSNEASHAMDGESSAKNGKDLMRLRKHSEMERTS